VAAYLTSLQHLTNTLDLKARVTSPGTSIKHTKQRTAPSPAPGVLRHCTLGMCSINVQEDHAHNQGTDSRQVNFNYKIGVIRYKVDKCIKPAMGNYPLYSTHWRMSQDVTCPQDIGQRPNSQDHMSPPPPPRSRAAGTTAPCACRKQRDKGAGARQRKRRPRREARRVHHDMLRAVCAEQHRGVNPL
jgi:hypothetical protein